VLGAQRQRVTPTIATGAERERLWRRFCAVAPLEHYQRRTRRTLPIVILTCAGASAPLHARARAVRGPAGRVAPPPYGWRSTR
jgi:F420H(2)-dependent quinone reductase